MSAEGWGRGEERGGPVLEERRGGGGPVLSFLCYCGSSLFVCSKLPYDVSNDQALEHEPVRQKVQETITTLSSLASRFQQSIFANIDKIP